MTMRENHGLSAESNTLQRVLSEFQGRALVTMCFRGRVCWTLQSLSIALGHDPKYLSKKLAEEWGKDLPFGTHRDIIKGDDLKEFRRLLELVPLGGNQFLPGLDPRAASLTIVYEPGLHKLLLKSESDVGDAIREHLASDVMPQLARTGRYDPDAGKALAAPSLNTELVIDLAKNIAQEIMRPMMDTMGLMARRLGVVEEMQIPRSDTVFCGPTEGSRLRSGMRRVAHLRTAHLRPETTANLTAAEWTARQTAWRRSWKRELGEIQEDVRGACNHHGTGKSWDFLPIKDLTPAWLRIQNLTAVAEREAEKRAKEAREAAADAQGDLFKKKN